MSPIYTASWIFKGCSSDLALHLHRDGRTYQTRSGFKNTRTLQFPYCNSLVALCALLIAHIIKTQCPQFVTQAYPNDIIWLFSLWKARFKSTEDIFQIKHCPPLHKYSNMIFLMISSI